MGEVGFQFRVSGFKFQRLGNTLKGENSKLETFIPFFAKSDTPEYR